MMAAYPLERLYSEVSTRESSTLVIATVASSASLVLMGLTEVNGKASAIIGFAGFLFPLLGFAYREVTIWTIDRIDHRRMNENIDDDDFRRERRRYSVYRGLILRTLLIFPSFLWLVIIDGSCPIIKPIALILTILVATLFTIIGHFLMND